MMIKRFDLQRKPYKSKNYRLHLKFAKFKLYTLKSQFSRKLNEVFRDHIDKSRSITSFSNIIDLISMRFKGVKMMLDTKTHGITCSQAFHRGYSNLQLHKGKLLGTVNLLVNPTAATFLSN